MKKVTLKNNLTDGTRCLCAPHTATLMSKLTNIFFYVISFIVHQSQSATLYFFGNLMKNLTTTVISNIMRSDFDFFLMMIFVSSVFKRGSGGPRSPQLLLIFRMLQLVKAGTGQQVTSLSKVVSQYTKCFYVIRNDVGCCISFASSM